MIRNTYKINASTLINPGNKYTAIIKIAELISGNDEFSHGGGDALLVDSFYEALANNAESSTSLVGSVESHLIALAAEESRKKGEVVYIH